MATKYSDLEMAINTLVSEFHTAAGDKPSMDTSQFKSMISKQLPALSQSVQSEEGLGNILKLMGVEGGQNISFENFWKLINNHAGGLFDSIPKPANCSCMLL